MSERLTPEENLARMKKYVREGGVKCFFCGSDVIYSNNSVWQAGEFIQEMQCGNCGRQWQDLYKLTAVHKIYKED